MCGEVHRNETRKLWEYWLFTYAVPYAFTPSDKRSDFITFEAYKNKSVEKAKADAIPWHEVDEQADDIRELFKRQKKRGRGE